MENQTDNQELIHHLNQPTTEKTFTFPIFISLIIAAIIFGVGTGYLTSNLTKKNKKEITTINKSTSKKTVGIVDKKTFKDKAEGILKEGGIDGEGSFHLERPGGKSQNVYLTSTTVDLSKFLGKKVRVWGETFQAEKAGWLMDVGLVEMLQ